MPKQITQCENYYMELFSYLSKMENSKLSYKGDQETNRSKDALKMSYNIITNCDSNISSNGFFRSSYALGVKKQSKLPAYVFDPHQPNPQDQQQTDKYVQKLRSLSKKQQKQSTIRKSQLGQNQLVFTNEEMMKLQVIDEFLEKGFELPEDPFSIQLFPTVKTDDLDIQACNKQSNHPSPFQEELMDFQQWGHQGNKQNVIQMVDQYTKECVDAINLKQLQKHKQKKRKQHKVLNFLRNCKTSQKKTHKEARARTSIEMDRQKVKIQKVPHIAPKLISQFETEKYLTLVDRRKFPSLDKTQKNSRMNHNLFKVMERKQKISQLTSYMNQKYLKIQSSAYMTPQRIQALYDCEIIKGAKQFMSKKDYINLNIALKLTTLPEQKINLQSFYADQAFLKKNQKSKEIDKSNEQIQKILEKNRDRLKIERQRIIQKLRC